MKNYKIAVAGTGYVGLSLSVLLAQHNQVMAVDIVQAKGDYLFPNLAVKDEPQTIGKYGMLRRTYLKENRKNWYQSMLMSGRLNQHLAEIEEAAESRVETLLDSLNEKFPAPSKEKDPLAWAAHQNNLTAMAEEIVLKELVYN